MNRIHGTEVGGESHYSGRTWRERVERCIILVFIFGLRMHGITAIGKVFFSSCLAHAGYLVL